MSARPPATATLWRFNARVATNTGRPVHPHAQVSRYGMPGTAIAGSKLVRDYCARCGEAIRVRDVKRLNICADCLTARPENVAGQAVGRERMGGAATKGTRY